MSDTVIETSTMNETHSRFIAIFVYLSYTRESLIEIPDILEIVCLQMATKVSKRQSNVAMPISASLEFNWIRPTRYVTSRIG